LAVDSSLVEVQKMTTTIHLGYEVGTGEPIAIPLRHTAVTGQTQESGKTTTLEGLIARSKLKAVAYVTKRGESSFRVMHPIAPYFLERADWKFVQSLLEAAMETRMDFKQAWIMRAADGAKTLEEVRGNIRRFLHGVHDPLGLKRKNRAKETKERWLVKPARGLNADVYYVLDKYFDEIMPQLNRMPYSKELSLAPGLNVMDLREYEFPLQALVVRSVIDWVHDHGEDTINVIPEAWKFAPKQKGSPVRQSAEEMIREGAAMKNFLWIDSQDLAGVADVLMRQVGVWLFGVQRAKHEIERALDHMPEGLPVRRPRPQDIATLSKGQFYVCFGREMHKVYVQPAWMTGAHAEAIARGEEPVESAHDILRTFDVVHKDVRTTGNEAVKDKECSDSAVLDTIREKARRGEALNSFAEAAEANARIFGVNNEETSTAASSSRRVNHPPEHESTSRLAVETEEGTGSRVEDTDSLESDEETMWKENYEELKHQYDALVKQSLSRASDTLFKEGLNPTLGGDVQSLDSIYAYVKSRAQTDPGVLQLLTDRSELRVQIERPVVTADTNTLFGRMAQLISEGFFKEVQGSRIVTAEAVRRGWCHRKTPFMRVQDPLDKLTAMGFLTRETEGYKAVTGVKIKVEEA
jgi:hypothetical protein